MARNLTPDLGDSADQPRNSLPAGSGSQHKEGPFVTGVMLDDALARPAGCREGPTLTTPRSFYLFGVTFYRSHSYRIAEASFNEALAIDERMGSVRLALANVYIHQKKWKDALNQFRPLFGAESEGPPTAASGSNPNESYSAALTASDAADVLGVTCHFSDRSVTSPNKKQRCPLTRSFIPDAFQYLHPIRTICGVRRVAPTGRTSPATTEFPSAAS
jgi:hypothetical protein